MVFKTKEVEPECVKVQLEVCGEVLKKIEDKQEEYKRATGRKLSKRLAIFKLILGK